MTDNLLTKEGVSSVPEIKATARMEITIYADGTSIFLIFLDSFQSVSPPKIKAAAPSPKRPDLDLVNINVQKNRTESEK